MTEITKICLFGDGVLETYLDIEGKLDSFYTLTDDLTTSVDEMNDPNGDVNYKNSGSKNGNRNFPSNSRILNCHYKRFKGC